MGCGSSRGTSIRTDDDTPQSHSPPDDKEELADEVQKVDIEPSDSPSHSSPSLTAIRELDGHNGNATLEPLFSNHVDTPFKEPSSGKKEPVAFDVTVDENGKSLIRKHPPKKFQKLEEQQQLGPIITPDELAKKQDSAQERRQKIISQRVQSAKQRTAKSAHIRMSSANSEENDELANNAIEGPEEV